jgi:hypothetical protein
MFGAGLAERICISVRGIGGVLVYERPVVAGYQQKYHQIAGMQRDIHERPKTTPIRTMQIFQRFSAAVAI